MIQKNKINWPSEIFNQDFESAFAAYQKVAKLESVFPVQEDLLRAFEFCSFDDLKVVILGQDPYHGKGQANGLAFSVSKGVKVPPSLRNIFKELEVEGFDISWESGDLSNWAKQGVLLLNSALSVLEGEPMSHKNLKWDLWTDFVIKYISENKKNVVFMLWGGYAKKKGSLINTEKHLVLTSGHPSPLSANRGYWFGNKHFSRCNTFLKEKGYMPIQW